MADYWNPIGLAVGGIGSLISGITGAFAASDQQKLAQKNYEEQVRMNDFNMNMQRENLDYQKALQQQIFTREDTATQRKAADLQKAGMSPILAAGQGAGAGSVVQTQPVQGEAPQKSGMGFEAKMQYAQMLNSIAQSAGQAYLIKQQGRQAKADADYQELINKREGDPKYQTAKIEEAIAKVENLKEQKKGMETNRQIAEIEREYAKSMGKPLSQITEAESIVRTYGLTPKDGLIWKAAISALLVGMRL